VEEMFPFELSLLDIASMAMVAMILIFYTIFLVKLKSPKEKESILDIKLEKKEKNDVKPKKTSKPIIKTEAVEETVPVVEKQAVPEENAKKAEVAVEVHVEKEEAHDDEKEAKKAFFLFGKKDFAGCVHKFGYLKTVPRNTPIPDECFGCPRILECLMQTKSK
jgi:type IV secretory pathway VirB10-like protein